MQGRRALSPPFHPLLLHGMRMETQNTGFLAYHNTPYYRQECAKVIRI